MLQRKEKIPFIRFVTTFTKSYLNLEWYTLLSLYESCFVRNQIVKYMYKGPVYVVLVSNKLFFIPKKPLIITYSVVYIML